MVGSKTVDPAESSGRGPTFSAIVVGGEVDAVAATLRSIGGRNGAWQTVSVLAKPEAHQALRQLRSPGGIAVELPQGAPALDGDYFCLVRAGGRLRPGAMAVIEAAINANAAADLIYCDDVAPSDQPDHLHHGAPAEGDEPVLSSPTLRPGFSPERLQAQMYLGEFVVLHRDLVERFASSAIATDLGCVLSSPLPHATALSLALEASLIVHIPAILYRRSGLGPVDFALGEVEIDAMGRLYREAGLEAYASADRPMAKLAEMPMVGDDRSAPDVSVRPEVLTINPDLGHQPLTTVVVPTIGTEREIDERPVRLVNQAVASIVRGTEYPNVEFVIVVGRGAPADLDASLSSAAGTPAIRFVYDDQPFNFSRACNLGAAAARGQMLAFVNDDTRLIDPQWLNRLVMYAAVDDVGAVGARLLYGDGRIQHAGIWTRGGHPHHRYGGYPAEAEGSEQSLLVPVNALATTGACLVLSHRKFDSVGGFSIRWPSSYNDVDLCLRLLAFGWRTVVVPQAAFTHYEASTRDPWSEPSELEMLHDRWRRTLINDPFDNPQHNALHSEELPAPSLLPEPLDGSRHAAMARCWPLEPMLAPFEPHLVLLKAPHGSAAPRNDEEASSCR